MAWRHYGGGVALRVSFAKIGARFTPVSALPGADTHRGQVRALSLLLQIAEHEAAAVQAAVDIVRDREAADWEVCIGARAPLAPEMASLIARMRGVPGVRIVTASDTLPMETAVQWTLEQATGRFVALLLPGVVPTASGLAALLNRASCGGGGTVLVGVKDDSPQVILLAKKDYLAQGGVWHLSVSEQVAAIQRSGIAFTNVDHDGATANRPIDCLVERRSFKA